MFLILIIPAISTVLTISSNNTIKANITIQRRKLNNEKRNNKKMLIL